MNKRRRNDEEENEQVKKYFSTNTQDNLNSQLHIKYENQMDICNDINDCEMTDVNKIPSAKLIVVKESHSSEILSLDFYPGLHRNITNKVGW